MQATLATVVAVVSALAAVISALYTVRATRLARKNLERAEEHDRRQQPHLDLYLINSHVERLKGLESRVYVFHLQISNLSDADNAVKSISLAISYSTQGGPLSVLLIPCDQSLIADLQVAVSPLLSVPSIIAAHSVVRGYALFRVPTAQITPASIEAYRVEAVDVHGIGTAIEPILISEVRHEETSEGDDHKGQRPD